MYLRIILGLIALAPLSLAQTYAERFETAWKLVNDRYWDISRIPVNWNDIKNKYQQKATTANSDEAFFNIIENMYQEIGDNHSIFVPPDKVEEIRLEYGDLPCLGVFGQNGGSQTYVEYEMLKKTIGYIKVPVLVDTASQLRHAVQDLKQQGAEKFILDLRDNPGGRLIEMMQDGGVFTNGFLWRTITRWTLPIPYPAIGSIETDAPLVVLINKHVNSAAEGLAGALQKKKRATLIGETSAGNVEAVLPFCLRDGSQAWIATGVLAPVGGPTWEGVGVIPDIETSSEEALEKALEFLGN
jgi:carboxyl-terminal processing protease